MITDIHISLTFNTDDNSLKVQATNNNVSQYQLDFFLRSLIAKMLNEEFVVDGDSGSYIEETFKLELE